MRHTGSKRPVGFGGLGQGIGPVMADEGMDVSVHARDLVEARLHGVAGGNLAFCQAGGEFGDGQLIEHGCGVCFWPVASAEVVRMRSPGHRASRKSLSQ